MEINLQCIGFKASEHLETFVTEKLQKLEPLAHKIIRANITLFQDGGSEPDNSYCEIRLEAPGNDPFVKKHGAGFEQSVADAVDALLNVLRKSKDKLEAHRHAG